MPVGIDLGKHSFHLQGQDWRMMGNRRKSRADRCSVSHSRSDDFGRSKAPRVINVSHDTDRH